MKTARLKGDGGRERSISSGNATPSIAGARRPDLSNGRFYVKANASRSFIVNFGFADCSERKEVWNSHRRADRTSIV